MKSLEDIIGLINLYFDPIEFDGVILYGAKADEYASTIDNILPCEINYAYTNKAPKYKNMLKIYTGGMYFDKKRLS